MAFLLQYNFQFDVTEGLSGSTPLRIAKGITSVDPDSNEETDETFYYDGEGAAQRDVTGLMLMWSFEGHRDYEDAAQNYIFSLSNKLGPDRKTNFTITYPDGQVVEGLATISEIKEPGGDANSKGEIEFTISFDGLPTITPATP